MKNKLKKFSILLIILFILISSLNCISRAENKIDNESLIQPRTISSENSIPENPAVVTDNVYVFSESDVTIDYDIAGDVFICSAKTVHISSKIYGNAFIASNQIDINENGFIQYSLFAASNSLNIKGSVNSTIYAACKTFAMDKNSSLNNDLFLTCQYANIDGAIARDAYISAEDIILSNNSTIGRNFKYSSEKEISIGENVVRGSVTYLPINTSDGTEDSTFNLRDFLYSTISYIIFALVVFIICKYIAPKFVENSSKNLKSNFGKTIGFGAIGLFIIPIICFFLLLSEFTLRLSFVMMGIYAILLAVASSLFVIALSRIVIEKCMKDTNTNNNVKAIISVVIIAFAYKLLKLVPIIGALINFLALLIGIGIFAVGILCDKKTCDNQEVK